MAQHEQQPEEAATRPLAAAASAAGSFSQTQMYGRGFRQQPATTGGKPARSQPAQPRKRAEHEAPQPTVDVDSPDHALSRLTRSLDDPELHAEILAGRPAGGGLEYAAATQLTEPKVVVACSAQESAAAAARLAQGQRIDPAPVAPPAPGMAPGL